MHLTADYINYIIHFVELFNLTLIFYVAFTWKNLPANFKWVAIEIFLIAPFLIVNYLFGLYFQMNNRFVAHLILHSDFILFSLFFYATLNSVFWKKAIKVFSVFFIAFSIFDYIFFESFIVNTPDNLSVLFYSWVVVLSLVGYYEIYNEGKITALGKSPIFWIITALFFEYSVSIFVYSTSNLWSYDLDLSITINLISSIIWFFYILMLLRAFQCVRMNSKSRNKNRIF